MKASDLILAGDVGGTKTLMSLHHENNGNPIEVKTIKYISRDFESLEAIIQDFLQKCDGVPMAAAFGIPGPVENGVVKSTNLPWIIDENLLIKHTGIPLVKLINDLVATAYILPKLTRDEITNIKEGVISKSPERYVVVAPGTGLGQSFLIKKDGKTIAIPSEGGHADFAPTSETEAGLYRFLLKKFGHVSYERVISGIGLPNIFDFIVEIKKEIPEKETLEKMKGHDRAVVISEMALAKADKVCEEALHLFVSILGSHAGNLALTFRPDGGVFLGGGIPYKIIPKMLDGTFVSRFVNKGRMRSVLENIPVNIILNNQAALKGAALVACEISKN